MELSACVEWQFADDGEELADRIRNAHAAGLTRCEFHLWRDKDLDAAAQALAETGVKLTGFCVDPRRSLVDPAQHDEFLGAVSDTLAEAKKLGSPPVIVASGFVREGMSPEEHKVEAIKALRAATDLAEVAGVTILLEPLNDRIDHPGMYLVDTALGLDLVEAVGSPNLKLLYDVYHSQVMGEDMVAKLSGRMHLVGHVQIADLPGRNEPGTGGLDLRAIVATLRELGYSGDLGLEYRPTRPAAQSLATAHEALGV